MYLGTSVSRKNLRERLLNFGAKTPCIVLSDDKLYETAAHDIVSGKIIGWVQGRMEWGPRSLGSRSILASPIGNNTQDKINQAIKFREKFRPFAPVLLESYFHNLVDSDKNAKIFSAYRMMLSTINTSVNSANKFPACVHIDQTSRIQIVPDESKHPICLLLHKLKKLDHPPLLVNTSFNLKGEPMVCDELDALNTFWHTALDALYIENVRIKQVYC